MPQIPHASHLDSSSSSASNDDDDDSSDASPAADRTADGGDSSSGEADGDGGAEIFDLRAGGSGGGGWTELRPGGFVTAHATNLNALSFLEKYKRDGKGKAVLVRWKYAHENLCERCEEPGDLVDCDYCNGTWHNESKCLVATDGTTHEPFDTDAVERWACPDCWKEAMEKFKLYQTAPTFKRAAPRKRRKIARMTS